jgi:hypothetical protein
MVSTRSKNCSSEEDEWPDGVFRTKVEGPAMGIDLVYTASRSALVGCILTLEKVCAEIQVCLDGIVLGNLDDALVPKWRRRRRQIVILNQ